MVREECLPDSLYSYLEGLGWHLTKPYVRVVLGASDSHTHFLGLRVPQGTHQHSIHFSFRVSGT